MVVAAGELRSLGEAREGDSAAQQDRKKGFGERHNC